MFYVLGNVTFCGRNVIKPQNVKQCYVLREPHLRFESYVVKIIITICVNLLRFALCFYVFGNVTFSTLQLSSESLLKTSGFRHCKHSTQCQTVAHSVVIISND